MLKGVTTGIAITIAATLVVGYIVVQSGYIPANADATPGPMRLGYLAHHWMPR